MIHVILNGGLGNNLFQYAVGRHLAIKNNTTIRFIVQKYLDRHDIFGRGIIKQLSLFNINPISYTTMIPRRFASLLGIHWLSYSDRVYHEKGFGFYPEVLELKDEIYLDGYFQSEKYFKDIEQIIRNDLRFIKGPFCEEGAIYKDQITKLNSVSLHIRRKDYLKLDLHNVCTMRYYERSIAYMHNQVVSPHFFVFSDDIEWCSKNLNIPHCSFVNIPISDKHPIIDMQLMSLCKHNIISNSTFSWWATWLNENPDKIVVTPNRWFNDESMNDRALRDTIPDNWIRIDVKEE